MEREKTSELSFLNTPDVQEFIDFRKINEEDWEKIEELAAIPKNLLISEMHNFFNLEKDRSAKELERLLSVAKDEERKRLYGLLLHFASKYHWTACWHLVSVLERK